MSHIKINGSHTTETTMTNNITYFQMMLWYLHFATHSSCLTGILAVWVWLPFPVEHLVVLAFSKNTRTFLLPCGNMHQG